MIPHNATVVMTCYRRPEYLRETLQSWLKVRGHENWRWWFQVEPSDQQDDVLDVITRFIDRHYQFQHPPGAEHFKPPLVSMVNALHGKVCLNEQRQGVLRNPWMALEAAFTIGDADYCVLAEEDIVVAEDVLELHEWAAHELDDTRALAVCSHSWDRFESMGENVVRWSDLFCPQVWGTWRGRWISDIRNSWDLDYSTGNPDGSEAGWDWNLGRVSRARHRAFVQPVRSRSQHIGRDGGTHTTLEIFEQTLSTSFGSQPHRLSYLLLDHDVSSVYDERVRAAGRGL